jgi:hypothetical protein
MQNSIIIELYTISKPINDLEVIFKVKEETFISVYTVKAKEDLKLIIFGSLFVLLVR